MQNKIEHLRNHLFETLEALKDKDDPMDLDRAKAITEVSQTIINSAKAENDYLKITGQARGTGFIPERAIQGSTKQPEPLNNEPSLSRVRN